MNHPTLIKKRSEDSQILQLHQGWDGCRYRALELISIEKPKLATNLPWKCEKDAHKANTDKKTKMLKCSDQH